jgi:hypothetical protein
LYDCIVYGKIPQCIDGTFYRVMPDAQFAPKFHDDVFINGDGQVDGIAQIPQSPPKTTVLNGLNGSFPNPQWTCRLQTEIRPNTKVHH